MITCATVLHNHGVTEINTAADAAKAIEPLVAGFPYAGLIAKVIFSVGILAIGLLAIPVLAGSCSYAVSETLGWNEGLYRRFKKACGFYGIIILATLLGLAINFIGIDPIQALIFSAVLNGVAAVPLLFIIAKTGRYQAVMGEYTNTVVSTRLIRIAFIVMLVSSVLMIGSMFFAK